VRRPPAVGLARCAPRIQLSAATSTPAERLLRQLSRGGLLTLWQVIEDTPGQRALLGLTDQ